MGHEKKTLSSDFAYFDCYKKNVARSCYVNLSTSLQVFAATVSFCLLRKLSKVGR